MSDSSVVVKVCSFSCVNCIQNILWEFLYGARPKQIKLGKVVRDISIKKQEFKSFHKYKDVVRFTY